MRSHLEMSSPFVKLSLLAADRGEVITSSSLEDIGKLHEGQPFFSEGLKDVFIQVAYQNLPGADPRAVISAPVRGMTAETIGVLVGWMRMNDLNKILSRPTQHQATETYLVDQSLLFLTQPMLADEPLELVRTDLSQAAISIDNASMLETIQKTNLEMTVAFDATLEGWSRAIEMRNMDMPGHTKRIADLTQRLALEMGVDHRELIHIRRGALLHTLMVPERIIHKAGPLTPREKKPWLSIPRTHLKC